MRHVCTIATLSLVLALGACGEKQSSTMTGPGPIVTDTVVDESPVIGEDEVAAARLSASDGVASSAGEVGPEANRAGE